MINNKPRVVILLDLDCFYAQCEIVRLGIDRSTPVALLQWNSALAVSYPAREFGIQRGDSFEKIQQKSQGKCVAFHLPIIPLQRNNNNNNNNNNTTSTDGSVKECYEKTFKLTSEEQSTIFKKEKNHMKNPNEGKASLERYRLASARIFEVILQHLLQNLGENNFILERASIDELFLDVSQICFNKEKYRSIVFNNNNNGSNETTNPNNTSTHDLTWKKSTKLLGEPSFPHYFNGESTNHSDDRYMNINDISSDPTSDDDDVTNPLDVGCRIAFGIRKCLYETLGFTMSAGISTNKLLAKLAAGYGKPDGMAILYPDGIHKVMDDTKIRKVRNLGGKIGKQVMSILPDDVSPTMGSIRRLLSLHDLTRSLSCPKLARMVFDACRGEDDEAVRETKLHECCLTKSITAFKSFRPVHTIDELDHWVRLLASDVVHRVEVDTKRNNRKPKNCNIQYTSSNSGVGFTPKSERTTRSVRIPFPTQNKMTMIDRASSSSKNNTDIPSSMIGIIDTLVENVKNALQTKNHFPLHRLGLSATDFIDIGQNGSTIETFFSRNNTNNKTSSNKTLISTVHKNDTNDGDDDGGTNKIIINDANVNDISSISVMKKSSTSECNNHTNQIEIEPSDKTEQKKGNDEDSRNVSCKLNIQTTLEDKLTNKSNSDTKTIDDDDDVLAEQNNYQEDLNYARKLQEFYNSSDADTDTIIPTNQMTHENNQIENIDIGKESLPLSPNTSENTTRDMILAQKLQASFDRENKIISSYEEKRIIVPTKKAISKRHYSSSKSVANGRGNKKGRIDSFFMKK